IAEYLMIIFKTILITSLNIFNTLEMLRKIFILTIIVLFLFEEISGRRYRYEDDYYDDYDYRPHHPRHQFRGHRWYGDRYRHRFGVHNYKQMSQPVTFRPTSRQTTREYVQQTTRPYVQPGRPNVEQTTW